MAIYTKNKVLRIPDYFDAVVRTNIHKLPFMAILKRGPRPKDWTQEVELEGATVSYQMAAAEGGDFNRNKIGKRINGTLKHELQKMRSVLGWAVTDEAEGMPSHTEQHGEKTKARQIRMDAQEVLLSQEHAYSSDQEAQERSNGDDNIAKTRGLMSWLAPFKKNGGETDKAAAERIHPVHTIDPKFMPHFGFEGNVKTEFDEDVLREMLEGMSNEQGDNMLTLTMLAGGYLKKHMTDFLNRVKVVNGVENTYRLNQMAGSKKKSLICDVFEYDSAILRVIRDNHLACTLKAADAKGIQYYEHNEAAKWAGALIRPEFWAVEFFEPLKNVELPRQGDQVCGYHKLIARLACRNPLAQGRIIHKTAAAG